MPLELKPKTPPYYTTTENVKVYRALLRQSGTNAPTAYILENTLGTIVWTYTNVGQYKGTLAGAFPREKTQIYFSSWNYDRFIGGDSNEDGEPSNEIYITTGNYSGGVISPGNGVLYYTPITILVYP